ncbi:uncharacterized protein DAT39_006712 [Clarias magur]|uniref:Uncharacterized protein n=1 Tax=Clarias magur TaxID=1594786 RepID=A0A8J4UTZ5_CLAMG|nr:uncharacterized protein DAT39_006712 [Clarias magur]
MPTQRLLLLQKGSKRHRMESEILSKKRLRRETPDAFLTEWNETEKVTVPATAPEEAEDLQAADTLSSAGHVIKVDQENEEFVKLTVKEEEPENADFRCEATSSSVGIVVLVDQQNGEFMRNAVKNKEPDDDDGYQYPANDEQGDETASPVSNNDLLKQLVVAHSSMSLQLTALSSQMTEQTLLLRGVLDEIRQQRDHKERMNALKRRKKEQRLAAIGKDGRYLHDSENNPDPQTEISTPFNQAGTTHHLEKLSEGFADAEPEIINELCTTMEEGLELFLRSRGIPEESITLMKQDKIDKSVLSIMNDEQLANYLKCYGDRIAVLAFCRQTRSNYNNESPLQGVRNKMKVRKLRSKADQKLFIKSSVSSSHGSLLARPKNTNAEKTARKIEIGWLHFCSNGYQQVRTRNGGGTKRITVAKTVTVEQILEMGKDFFFPDGLSTKGPAEHFIFHVCDFKRNKISMGDTVGQLYEQTKLKMLRFYICTKDADSSSLIGSDSDVEEYSSDSDSYDTLE